MFFLGALWLGQWVKQRWGRGGQDGRVLRGDGWEEEEQEEAGHRRAGGVLRGRCHGDDLSSNCQGGPLRYSWRREETTSAPHCNIFTPGFKDEKLSLSHFKIISSLQLSIPGGFRL